MPYKSQAQRRLFHWLESQGKISSKKVSEYDTASKGKKLPERVKKAFGGEVYAKEGTHCPACDLPLDSAPVAMDAGEGCPRCGFGDAKNVPKKMAMGGEVTPSSDKAPAYRERIGHLMRAADEGLKAGMKETEPKHRPRPRRFGMGSQESMAPTTYRAHGGEIQCAHCGEMTYVPNKAHGGMMADKQEFPHKKTGHVDDGKPKAGFAKALKSRK